MRQYQTPSMSIDVVTLEDVIRTSLSVGGTIDSIQSIEFSSLS